MALDIGATGDEVTQIQILLRAAGYTIPITGVYDQATLDAVRNWQGRLGVPPSGQWDQATTSATLSLSNNGTQGNVLIPPRASSGMDLGRWQVQRDLQRVQTSGNFPSSGELDGVTILTNTLDAIGLGSLNQWAIEQLQIGRSEDEIFILLQDQPAFHDRFPAWRDLQRMGQAMTIPEMLQYEDQMAEIMRTAGFPAYFFDGPEDFADLMRARKSPMEIQAQINDGYAQVANAHPSVREAFREYFGIEGDVALAMTFIDPGRSTQALLRMANEATVSGAARRMNFSISRPLIEEMVKVGIEAQDSMRIFQEIDQIRPIFDNQLGEQDNLNVEDTVRGMSGTGPGNQIDVEARRLRRVGLGSGAGGATVLEEGLSLGAANE